MNQRLRCFSLASSASRIAFSIQLVIVRASAAAASLIRSVMPAGNRRPMRSGRAPAVVSTCTFFLFPLDTVCTLYVQRLHDPVNSAARAALNARLTMCATVGQDSPLGRMIGTNPS